MRVPCGRQQRRYMDKQDERLFPGTDVQREQHAPDMYTRTSAEMKGDVEQARPERLVKSRRQLELEGNGEIPDGWKKPDSADQPEKAENRENRESRFSAREDAQEEKKPSQRTKRAEKAAEKKKNAKKKTTQEGEKRGFLKRMAVIALVFVLFAGVALMVVSNFVDAPILQAPKKVVTAMITPVQKAFSGLTDSIASYLRTLKVRGNIEYEYEQLLIKLDDLASEAAMAEEYKRQINDLYDLMDEINRNTDLNPLAANVIGHDTGNYFSVLTINVGSNHGVKDYMAVVYDGGLVGYTYDVEENTCSVRCIIDSDATVFGMIQSSRDQGAVKGTLGIDGNARCRMYYLPENALPRPGDVVVTSGVGMEFPKGIPIGTVRESTRGMDENKSFIVVEPIVDFQHLEYVVVYRYQPSYAESAQERDVGVQATLEPLVTARPQPTFQVGIDSGFASASPDPNATQTPAPEETPEPTFTPSPSPTVDPDATPVPENLTYQAPDHVGGTETPEPTSTPSPTPEPTPTFNPDELTVEEEE